MDQVDEFRCRGISLNPEVTFGAGAEADSE